MTVAVVDYGMGNLRSVAKALEAVGAQVSVSINPRICEKQSVLFFRVREHFAIASPICVRRGC